MSSNLAFPSISQRIGEGTLDILKLNITPGNYRRSSIDKLANLPPYLKVNNLSNSAPARNENTKFMCINTQRISCQPDLAPLTEGRITNPSPQE